MSSICQDCVKCWEKKKVEPLFFCDWQSSKNKEMEWKKNRTETLFTFVWNDTITEVMVQENLQSGVTKVRIPNYF